jgi:hypothetical protein
VAAPDNGHLTQERQEASFSRQQPEGDIGDTPGVAAAPVALAGLIVPGVARSIVTLSAQADVFGVGITIIVGSMLVLTSCVIAGWMVPSGGLDGIAGVESGKAAPLVGGPPGIELHTMVDELPSGVVGEAFPVLVPTTSVGMVPNGAPALVAVDGSVVAVLPVTGVETVFCIVDVDGVSVLLIVDMEDVAGVGPAVAGVDDAGIVVPGIVDRNEVAGVAESKSGAVVPTVVDVEADTENVVGAADIDPVVPPAADKDATDTAGVPGVICPAGVEQVTTVPGVVGSEASGTGASVVSGAPGWVVAENGLGPLSGEVKIVPGVDERPMAVLPMVETCARQAVQPANMVAIVNSKRRISIPLRTGLARLRRTHRHLAAFRQVHHRIEHDLITWLDAVVHFDFRAKVARDRDFLQVDGAVLDHRDMQAILIEYDGVGRYHHRWCLARDQQINGAVDSRAECAVGVGNVDLGQQRPAAGLQR